MFFLAGVATNCLRFVSVVYLEASKGRNLIVVGDANVNICTPSYGAISMKS